MEITVHEFPDMKSLSVQSARHIAGLIKESIESKGRCIISLSGGSSPRHVYEKLSNPEIYAGIDWSRVFIFWGDERYTGHTSEESNYYMAYRALLSKVSIPQENIFRVPVEVEPAKYAAVLYERIMEKFFMSMGAVDAKKRMPVFDIVLLGIGADGHTASLFPGHEAVNEKKRWVVSLEAPEGNRERITMTIPVLNSACSVIFIVSGSGKGKIIRSVLEERGADKKDYPASKIIPETGTVWFVDKRAVK